VTRPSAPSGGQWPSSGEGRGRLPSADHDSWRSARDDDGWGPATAVYSSAATPDVAAPSTRSGRAFYPSDSARPQPAADPWGTAGPQSSRERRAVRAADRRTERSVLALQEHAPERGLSWWAALLVLIAIACVGGLIDTLGSIQVKGGFNIGIVVASIVAVLVVKRSHMFPVVIAPPIVYSAAALFQLYVRSSGLHDKRVVFDAAANYLVYGFPAIAAASAAVLIIAGIRLIARK
jgi:hypothetical protein